MSGYGCRGDELSCASWHHLSLLALNSFEDMGTLKNIQKLGPCYFVTIIIIAPILMTMIVFVNIIVIILILIIVIITNDHI